MSANFNVPGGYQKFRFWCQKALPLVYDDALSYYELLCKVVDYINKLLDGQNQTAEAFEQLQDYVNNYFDSQDFDVLVSAKLDEMAEDGTLDQLINQEIFSGLNDEITALDGRMDTAESNITALQAAVADIRARKWLIMGDSYAAGWTNDGTVTGFPTIVKNALGISNANWSVFDTGGYGFYGGAGKWYDIITGYGSSWSQSVRESYTDVVFIGGYNDAIRMYNSSITMSQLRNAAQDCITATKTAFPKATIHNAFCGRDSRGQTVNSFNNAMLVYQELSKMGCGYWNLENALHITTRQSSDGIHANLDGQYAIANGMIDCMIEGHTSYNITSWPVLTSTIINNFGVGEFVNGDISTFYMSQNCVFSTPVTNWQCQSGNGIVLGEVSNYAIAGNSALNTNFNTSCVIWEGTNLVVTEGIIYVRDGVISFDCYALDGNTFKTFTSVNRIVFANTVFNVSTRWC